MNQEETTDKRYSPVIVAYAVSVIFGFSVSVGLATYWLGLSSLWVAVVVGGLLAIFGASMGEAIGDAIIFSFISGVLVMIFILVGPEIAILRAGIVPAATGLCVGKLVASVMHEMSTQVSSDHSCRTNSSLSLLTGWIGTGTAPCLAKKSIIVSQTGQVRLSRR